MSRRCSTSICTSSTRSRRRRRFDGLRLAGRKVRRPDRSIATVDHNVPTTANRLVIEDPIAAKQIEDAAEELRGFWHRHCTTCNRRGRASCM
jgi:homoaconitase/3-isopropylmalate dehydratase large subunit